MDFDFEFNYVMNHEDAARKGTITYDAGGETRFGVASKYHPEEYPALAEMSVADALARARIIFLRDYVPEMMTRLDNVRVRAKILDVDFNLGAALGKPHGMGILIAQKSCTALGKPVTEDGTLGSNTVDAINACDPDKLLGMLCAFEQATLEHEYQVKGKTCPPGLITRAKDVPPKVLQAVS